MGACGAPLEFLRGSLETGLYDSGLEGGALGLEVVFFLLLIADEDEKVRTRLALLDFWDLPGLAALVLIGVPFLSFSASSAALAFIYLPYFKHDHSIYFQIMTIVVI